MTDQIQTRVVGTDLLKSLILVGFVLAFIVLYFRFALDVVNAAPGHPPRIDPSLTNVAGGLAGILGTGFALALGVAKTDDSHTNRLMSGNFLGGPGGPFEGVSLAVSFGVWAFPVVAFGVGAVVLTHLSESPPVLTTLVSVAAGYVLAFATAAFRSVRG
jgi:hypothetical protein